jgi:hypothetical protein
MFVAAALVVGGKASTASGPAALHEKGQGKGTIEEE